MRRRSIAGAAATAALLLLAHGCASVQLPAVDGRLIEAARTAGVGVESLERGHRVMVTACSACHRPVHPGAITLDRWDEELPDMVAKARLTAADGAAIRAYVVAVRSVAPAAGPEPR
ncbi:MAG TPA: hypothetical protein VFZ65_18135 [Planctomycetota bacterium]|nr:hypothetical protein [Planctomycetota bacterium]